MAGGSQEARSGVEPRVSVLEQALWKALGAGDGGPAHVRAWLGLQCRFVPGARAGVVVLAGGGGQFAPAAVWPDEGAFDDAISSGVDLAIAERRPVAEEADGAATLAVQPLVVDGRLAGAAGLVLDPAAAPSGAEVLRRLRWGLGWLESLVRAREGQARAALTDRTVAAFELVASALEQQRFRPAATAVVTDLALRLDCEQVAVGFLGGRDTVRVAALSHSAQFGRRMDLVRRIGHAMDEAIDQEAAVLWPLGEDWEYRITHAHGELAESLGGGTILTVPLHQGGEMLGALTLARRAAEPFDDDTIATVDTVAAMIGPILEEKRLNDRIILAKIWQTLKTQTRRLLGPRYFGRKLATLVAAAVVAFFALAEGDFRVTAPAVLEGQVQRALVAPFDGFVAAQHAKAGDVVEEGALLAALDDRDLVLERLRRTAERRERQAEYDRALAEDDRVEARILRAQLAETEAQIELIDARLARTEVRAPFDGLVISGDLSQSIGSGVRRGDALFTVAPLDSYRVVLEVDEADLSEMQEGQAGTLVVAALPDTGLPYTVERITPISTAEEGRNYFRVEAALDGADPRLRPGMEGVGKTFVDERLLIEIWTRRLVDWVRLAAWRWLP